MSKSSIIAKLFRFRPWKVKDIKLSQPAPGDMIGFPRLIRNRPDDRTLWIIRFEPSEPYGDCETYLANIKADTKDEALHRFFEFHQGAVLECMPAADYHKREAARWRDFEELNGL